MMNPKLRQLDLRPILHQGRPSLLVRDPLELSEQYLILPQALTPALLLCDGKHDLAQIEQAMVAGHGVLVERQALEELVAALDRALMLDNEASSQAAQAALTVFRAAPFRPPASAGEGYPAQPDQLRALFDRFLAAAGRAAPAASGARALISPHIDYQRGNAVYARVWKAAAEAARAADLVVVFGTDHYAGHNQVTLTKQDYATPYGVLPTDQELVAALAGAIGEEAAFAGELYHRREHSIELVVTWLHHMRGGQPVNMVPILTGSFLPFLEQGRDPAADPVLNAFLDTLKQQTQGRQVLIVASGDLAHIGPAFGGEAVGIIERADLRGHDEEMMGLLAAGDAGDFWHFVVQTGDSKNVCGVSPFYLTLKLLGHVEGNRAGYAVCPADAHDTSVVSICGMVFG